MSFCFFTNWIVDYGITRATPNMLTNLGWGTFLLYAILTYVGTGFIWACMPETKVRPWLLHYVRLRELTKLSQGRSIESMDDLFQRPLWMMWKYAYPKEEDKVRRDVQSEGLDKGLDDLDMDGSVRDKGDVSTNEYAMSQRQQV